MRGRWSTNFWPLLVQKYPLIFRGNLGFTTQTRDSSHTPSRCGVGVVGRVCRLVGKLRLGAAARPGVVSGFPEHCCQWWGWRCRGFIPRAGCRPKAERQGVEAARPRRLATGQRPRGRRVSAFEQILRGAAPRRPLRDRVSCVSNARCGVCASRARVRFTVSGESADLGLVL